MQQHPNLTSGEQTRLEALMRKPIPKLTNDELGEMQTLCKKALAHLRSRPCRRPKPEDFSRALFN